MEPDYYLGKRLSYSNDLCTVRYIGEVKGTKGPWLGVEWDDPTRGKHSGERDGVRYFECEDFSTSVFLFKAVYVYVYFRNVGKSGHSKAGSFVRPSRVADSPLSFLEGLHKKYASESEQFNFSNNQSIVRSNLDSQIEISSKVVEEVGFEKIRKLLADLHELRIVLLDGLCIGGLLAARSSSDEDDLKKEVSNIEQTCPNIQELDLSLNLLEDWWDVALICSALNHLQSLKVMYVK